MTRNFFLCFIFSSFFFQPAFALYLADFDNADENFCEQISPETISSCCNQVVQSMCEGGKIVLGHVHRNAKTYGVIFILCGAAMAAADRVFEHDNSSCVCPGQLDGNFQVTQKSDGTVSLCANYFGSFVTGFCATTVKKVSEELLWSLQTMQRGQYGMKLLLDQQAGELCVYTTNQDVPQIVLTWCTEFIDEKWLKLKLDLFSRLADAVGNNAVPQ